MVANDFEIPPKPPCGKCEGCKCKSARQSAPKAWPKPPENRLINDSGSVFSSFSFLIFICVAIFITGFIFGLSAGEVK